MDPCEKMGGGLGAVQACGEREGRRKQRAQGGAGAEENQSAARPSATAGHRDVRPPEAKSLRALLSSLCGDT